jgi:hypothetical protein
MNAGTQRRMEILLPLLPVNLNQLLYEKISLDFLNNLRV